jgi:hypothetical protein
MIGVGIATSPSTNGQVDSVGSESTTTTAPSIAVEPETGFPDGYVQISPDVAVAALTTYTVEGDSYVVVTALTRGSVDPDSTFMTSIGSWILRNPGGDVAMVSQTSHDVPGMFQIRFPAPIAEGAILVASPTEEWREETVLLLDDVPTEMVVEEPIEVDVGGVPVVISELSWSLTRGYAQWLSPGGVPLTVNIVVTLLGTDGAGIGDLPIRIMSYESVALYLDTDARTDVPSWNTQGQLVLGRAGVFEFDEGLIESVTVDAVIRIASNFGQDVEIPLP